MTDVITTVKYKLELEGEISSDLLAALEEQFKIQLSWVGSRRCKIIAGKSSTGQWLPRVLQLIRHYQPRESLQALVVAHYIEADFPIVIYDVSTEIIDLLSDLNGRFQLLLNRTNSSASSEELNLDYSSAALVVYCQHITPTELNRLVEEPPNYIYQSTSKGRAEHQTARFEYNDADHQPLELLEYLIPELLDCIKSPAFAKALPDAMWQIGLFTNNHTPHSLSLEFCDDLLLLLKESRLPLRVDFFFN